jgi:hypothetical protein
MVNEARKYLATSIIIQETVFFVATFMMYLHHNKRVLSCLAFIILTLKSCLWKNKCEECVGNTLSITEWVGSKSLRTSERQSLTRIFCNRQNCNFVRVSIRWDYTVQGETPHGWEPQYTKPPWINTCRSVNWLEESCIKSVLLIKSALWFQCHIFFMRSQQRRDKNWKWKYFYNNASCMSTDIVLNRMTVVGLTIKLSPCVNSEILLCVNKYIVSWGVKRPGVLRIRMRRALPPLPHISLWCGAQAQG